MFYGGAAPLSPTSRKGKLDFVSRRHGAILHLGNAFGHGIKEINEDVYCLCWLQRYAATRCNPHAATYAKANSAHLSLS
jgi:hypothetical protein